MDLETVAYADPLRPLKFHIPGAMYHAKGFTPWGAPRYGQATRDLYSSYYGHFIDPGAYLIRWYVEGDGRARDLHDLWIGAMKVYKTWPSANRETCTAMGEAIEAYRATWDPDFIGLLHPMAGAMFSVPFSKWQSASHHPHFHALWLNRWHDLARDPRILPAIDQYIADGFRACPTMQVLRFDLGADPAGLQEFVPAVYDRLHAIFRKPGDPFDGYEGGSFPADPYSFHTHVVYWMHAARRAGLLKLEQPAGDDGSSVYPYTHSHVQYLANETPGLHVLALNPAGKDFAWRLESPGGYDSDAILFRVLAPDGAELLRKPLTNPEEGRKLRYIGEHVLNFPVEAGGRKGLYALEARAHQPLFVAPVTQLPAEGLLLKKDVLYNVTGRASGFMAPRAEGQVLKLQLSAIDFRTRFVTVYVELVDAKGASVANTTLLYKTARETEEIVLDPAKHPPPWRFYANHYGWMKVLEGDGGLLFAPRAEMLAPLREALDSAGPKP
ncbi:MAG: hypothetical protein M5U26_01335 [Planctomycetota bacterium]|nr:hypothetical protein [Planctomycetota bacterium]